TTSSGPPTFPDEERFTRSNFSTWSTRIRIAANIQGAGGYIDRSIKKPDKTTASETLSPGDTKPTPALEPTQWDDENPSRKEWTRDAWTMGLIYYNIENPIGLGVDMSNSAADAWTSLKS
ncbi:hypothetical protein M422DRAFT_83821, partial [Sphaerobolus stellatus SS14]